MNYNGGLIKLDRVGPVDNRPSPKGVYRTAPATPGLLKLDKLAPLMTDPPQLAPPLCTVFKGYIYIFFQSIRPLG